MSIEKGVVEMSSTMYIKFEKAIPLTEWNEFCKRNHVEYSPNTVGRNVYYLGQVEMNFGDPVWKELPYVEKEISDAAFHCHNISTETTPRRPVYTRVYDFSKASPNPFATEISVGTYFDGDLEAVVAVVKKVMVAFGDKYDGRVKGMAPEFKSLYPRVVPG